MSGLRVESPANHAAFAALCPSTPLPWSADPSRDWVIIDREGYIVCEVPGNSEETIRIVGMILCAVNTCGGFKLERG